jgi:hypothetical protein
MTRRTPPEALARRSWLLEVGAGRLRRASGVTQQAVADALGVSQAAVCDWENGRRAPAGPEGTAFCRFIADLARRHETGRDRYAAPPQPCALCGHPDSRHQFYVPGSDSDDAPCPDCPGGVCRAPEEQEAA